METNSKKSRHLFFLRFLGRAVPAVFAGVVLAACGGGGGGGGNGSVIAKECDSTMRQEAGFAVGTCSVPGPSAGKTVMRDVRETVQVSSSTQYRISLQFPPGTLSNLDSITFTDPGDLSPVLTGGLHRRTFLGELSGVAFENPVGDELTPPFVALIDFRKASRFVTATTLGPEVLNLDSVSFGTWERSVVPGEGYFGVWFAQRPGGSDHEWPADADFSGFAVGVLGATNSTAFSRLAMSDPNFESGGTARGFSANVSMEIRGGVVSGTIESFTVSIANAAGEIQSVANFGLQPMTLRSTGGSTPGIVTGTLSSPEIEDGKGFFEAGFFGHQSVPGSKEIGGRFRFETRDGLVGVGSFGAHL